MAHTNKVLSSTESPDGSLCVDIFVRPDGSFGFDEFRRDVEDARGWFAVGGYGERCFATRDAAVKEALASVAWLRRVMY